MTLDYTRNDAGQVTAKDFTDNDYIWSPPANGTDTYVATALNQFSSVPAGTPTYDNNGNMTYDGAFTFIYDAENRLTQAKNGATVLGDYEYDPLGRRSKKTVKPATDNLETEYLYAGAHVLAEYDGATGDLLRRYVYAPGIDDPLAILNEDGDVTYFHSDGLGSIIALSDEAGANTDIFTHGPFGEVDTNSGGSAYKYTARRIDEETGLYYYRNRYYHPEIGRFMSADPIGYGAGLNMYAYVGNDPMNFTDPSGLSNDTPEIIVTHRDIGVGSTLNEVGLHGGDLSVLTGGGFGNAFGGFSGLAPLAQDLGDEEEEEEDEVPELVVTGSRDLLAFMACRLTNITRAFDHCGYFITDRNLGIKFQFSLQGYATEFDDQPQDPNDCNSAGRSSTSTQDCEAFQDPDNAPGGFRVQLTRVCSPSDTLQGAIRRSIPEGLTFGQGPYRPLSRNSNRASTSPPFFAGLFIPNLGNAIGQRTGCQ